MEWGNYWPSQNRHPSTDHQKICQRWLRRQPLRLCQIRCISVHRGLLGTWVKYNENYFYLYLFEELTYTSDASTDFHALWLKRHGLAQGCAFLRIFSHYSPFRGSKKPNFGAWIGVFTLTLPFRLCQRGSHCLFMIFAVFDPSPSTVCINCSFLHLYKIKL